MTTYGQVVARVAAVAALLLPTLVVLTGMGAVAAVAAGVGVAAADDWSRRGLVLGGVALILVGLVPLRLGRFAGDIARVRRLPEVTRDQLSAAATQLGGRVSEGHQQVMGARGLARAWQVAKAARTIRSDLEALSDGGLAPATALVQALVPARIVVVTLASVATPFLLAAGLLVLVVGLTLV